MTHSKKIRFKNLCVFLGIIILSCRPQTSGWTPGSIGDECADTDDCDQTLGLICDEGLCAEPPACQEDETLCVDDCCLPNENCTENGCCLSTMTCGTACCEAPEFCHEGECTLCPNTFCNGECCDIGESCHNGECCTEEQICGSACCGDGFLCELEQCRRDCGELTRCGETDQCCEVEEICFFGECIDPGGPCRTTNDCDPDEYCDPELDLCLPRAETGECQFIPGVIEGEFNTPVLNWEWTGGDVMMPPVVANLTDDNEDGRIDEHDIPDVVVSYFVSSYTSPSTVVVLSGDDGRELLRISDYAVKGGTGIAVGDVDGDGMPEIVACRYEGGVYVFNHDGSVESYISQGCASLYSAPTLADLEGDGIVEIITDYTIISDGVQRCVPSGHALANSATVAIDITGDDELEVVGGRVAMDAECNIIWQDMSICEGHPGIADFDLDGDPELVVGSDQFFVMNAEDGSRIHTRSIVGGAGYGCIYAFTPSIADFDGDGVPEIVLPGHSSFTVYDMDCLPEGGVGDCISGSTDMIVWTSATDDSSGYAGPSAFDFDGDGISEVVYADQRILRVYRGDDGTVLYQDERSSGTLWEYPLVADVNNDNHAEIIVVSENQHMSGTHQGVRVFADSENAWVTTRNIWNQFSYHITNVNPDGSIPTIMERNWRVETLNNFRENRVIEGEGLFTSPDLVISHTLAMTRYCPERLELSARLTNLGSATAPSNIPVSFFVQTEESVSFLIDVLYTTRRLSPGESEVLTLPFELRTEDLDTPIDFYVIADSTETNDDVIHECHEDNNTSEIFSGMCTTIE